MSARGDDAMRISRRRLAPNDLCMYEQDRPPVHVPDLLFHVGSVFEQIEGLISVAHAAAFVLNPSKPPE